MVLTFEYYDQGIAHIHNLWAFICQASITHYDRYQSLGHRTFGRRRVLISVPGGQAFSEIEPRLSDELRAVWLKDEACHPTDPCHPFDTCCCPHSRDKDCWQCLYILKVREILKRGDVLIAATTNVASRHWEKTYSAGSSEVADEDFEPPPPLSPRNNLRITHVDTFARPSGWGTGEFKSGGLSQCCRKAAAAPDDAGEPLGAGCRWERKFLHSLDDKVVCVAQPPFSLFQLISWTTARSYLVGALAACSGGLFYIIFFMFWGNLSNYVLRASLALLPLVANSAVVTIAAYWSHKVLILRCSLALAWVADFCFVIEVAKTVMVWTTSAFSIFSTAHWLVVSCAVCWVAVHLLLSGDCLYMLMRATFPAKAVDAKQDPRYLSRGELDFDVQSSISSLPKILS